MNEELKFILSVESDGAEAASQKTAGALDRVGQGFTRAQKAIQNGSKAIDQTLGNIVSLVKSTATKVQNQYNRMSPEKLSSEFTRLEERIIKQQSVVAQANQELEEYAALWDQIAASGARTAGTADQDAQLAKLAQSANQAAAELKELQAAQQQVAAAMVNNPQYAQQMDIARQKTAQTKMGIDAMAFSITTIGRAIGGTTGQIIMLAKEVLYLKQAFTATAAEAGIMAAAINTSLGVIGIVVMAITMVVGAINDANEKAKAAMEELREEIKSLSGDNVGAAELVAEFESISKKVVKTADDTGRMKDIREELVKTYGFSVAAVDEEGRLLSGNLELMKEQLRVSQQLLLTKLQANEEAELKAYNDALRDRIQALKDIASWEEAIKDPDSVSRDQTWSQTERDMIIGEWNKSLKGAEKNRDQAIKDARIAINNLFQQLILEVQAGGQDVSEALQQAIRTAMQNAFAQGQDADAAMKIGKDMLSRAFAIDASVVESKVTAIQDLRTKLISAFTSDAYIDPDVAAARINSILDTLLGEGAGEEAYARAEELRQRIWDGLASPEEIAEYDTLMQQIGDSINNTFNSVSSQVAVDALYALKGSVVTTSAELRKMAAAEEAAKKSLKDAASDLRSVAFAYDNVSKEIKEVANLKGAVKAIEDYTSATDTSADAAKKAEQAREYLADAYDIEKDAVDGMLPSIDDDTAMKEALALADYAVGLQAALSAQAQISAMMAAKTVTVEQGQIMIDALQGVINKMAELGSSSVSAAGTTIKPNFTSGGGGSGGGGGGGGGSKNKALQKQLDQLERYRALDQLTTAEEIANLERIRAKYAKTAAEKQDIDEKLYALRKQLREDEMAYQTALDRLTLREQIAIMDDMMAGLKEGTDARRELEKERYQAARELEKQEYDLKVYYGQLTLEQQEAALKELVATYKEGTAARIELEKELYDVQKQMKQRDIDNLNGLVDAVTSALKERYETQRQAEEDTLNASIKAWQNWGKEQVAAIQAQIDAIDALTKAEDDAEVEAQKRRKIAALEQAVAYEQDAYNRKKLQEQLSAAQDDLNKWLRNKEREALKASLKDQIDAVNTTVDQQTDALEEQIKANDAYYDELTKAQNLQAEAQRLIMQSSQTEIIDLLKAFAPEYNATGQTLGEQLVDGFMSRVGDIEAWFKNLTAGLTAYRQQMAAVATAAADQFYAVHGIPTAAAPAPATGPVTNVGPTINVYFTEQRDYTPTEVRRELERMLEQITQM